MRTSSLVKQFLVATLACVAAGLACCSPNRVSPGGGNPEIYQHFTDRWKAKYGNDHFGQVCEDREAKDCFRFGPARRMRGLWSAGIVGGFEQDSSFLDEAQVAPSTKRKLQELLGGVALDPTPLMHTLHPGDYEVELIGRKTLHPGEYDIWGRRHLIVVDQLVSYRRVSFDDWMRRHPL